MIIKNLFSSVKKAVDVEKCRKSSDHIKTEKNTYH